MNRNTAIKAFFNANPGVTFIITEFGHAYGHARFESTCSLTKTRILAGRAIRKVSIVTRAGREWTGYIANDTFGLLVGCESSRITFDGGWIDAWVCRWSKWTGVEAVEATLRAAAPGTRITTIGTNGRDSEKVYGTQGGGRWGRRGISTNSLIANLRRSTQLKLYRLEVRG